MTIKEQKGYDSWRCGKCGGWHNPAVACKEENLRTIARAWREWKSNGKKGSPQKTAEDFLDYLFKRTERSD